jgi:hypothetical protein
VFDHTTVDRRFPYPPPVIVHVEGLSHVPPPEPSVVMLKLPIDLPFWPSACGVTQQAMEYVVLAGYPVITR